MATRTIHPLPKRPSFASVPAASSSSQRHSQQPQQHAHPTSTATHPQSSIARGQSETSAASPSTPVASVSTPLTTTAHITQPFSQIPQSSSKRICLPPPLTENTALLGSQISLDSSFHISSATYTGTPIDCERFREHIISQWKEGPSVLDHYLIDYGQVDEQVTLYRYEDILCDTDDFSKDFSMNLGESNVCTADILLKHA